MSASDTIDGYAAQNTKYVLCALEVHRNKLASSSPAEAIQAAIATYLTLSRKQVTERTVRRWLDVVESYGGIERTPKNAFGALKSCPHVSRPSRDQLRAIEKEAARLVKVCRPSITPRQVVELASIARALQDCCARVLDDPAGCQLATIETMARMMSKASSYRLFRHVPEAEVESMLREALSRLKGIAANAPQTAV